MFYIPGSTVSRLDSTYYKPSPDLYFWDVPPVFNLYSACISPTVSLVSHCITVYLSTSSNFAAGPLYPAVSHCIQLYPYVSSCIQLYPAVSHRIPPPPSKTGYGQKYTLQGRAILHIHTCMYMYLCIGIGGGEAICIYKSRNVHVHVPIYTTHYPIYTTFIKNLCLCIYHDQNEGCMLCKC